MLPRGHELDNVLPNFDNGTRLQFDQHNLLASPASGLCNGRTAS
jgi:hypothetical protein